MNGKEIKARTRIMCPLCGSMGWQSQFDKKKPLLKMFTQWSPGFRKIKYQENTNIEMLKGLHMYLIEKVEELYEKLTGINIQKLIKQSGGDKEWQSSKSAWIRTVPTTFYSKTADVSNNLKTNVTESKFMRISRKT